MAKVKTEYKAVPSESDSESLLHEYQDPEKFQPTPRRRCTIKNAVLSLSLIANIVLLAIVARLTVRSPLHNGTSDKSEYIELTYNTWRPIDWFPERSGDNDTLRDHTWLDDTITDQGMIAVDNSYAEEMGLMPSFPFFWDDSKTLYVINAFHSLHCLQLLYRVIKEYRDGVPESEQEYSHHHAVHCLDGLRSEIMCSADDTLLYLTKTGAGSGQAQPRQCRDWSQLEQWSKDHNACFKHVHPFDKTIKEVERFKYCDNDSKYLPKVREYFGLEEGWKPWPYKEQETWMRQEYDTPGE